MADMGTDNYEQEFTLGLVETERRLLREINHALAKIPADRVRLHICWGNYEGSHVHDMDCMKIFPIALKAKPIALLIEAANPRH